MKAKIAIVAFAVAVIASFSFITINKSAVAKKTQTVTVKHDQPTDGFALQDENQF